MNPAPLTADSLLTPSRESLASASGSLSWVLYGPEWRADPETGISYVVMDWEGSWQAFLFHGTRYKRGWTLSENPTATADEAKAICESHYQPK